MSETERREALRNYKDAATTWEGDGNMIWQTAKWFANLAKVFKDCGRDSDNLKGWRTA